MFSVSLLYAARDFLQLVPEAGLTVEDFKKYFQTFKYSNPSNILDISFKCGWSKLTPFGQIELDTRGIEISKCEYQPALLLQLEDLILNLNPVWGGLLLKGRTEAQNYLPPDVLQCFKESGLFGKLTDEIVEYWDKLAIAYRNYSQRRMTEIGRTGERLSFDHELQRTGIEPLWQAVESNLAGFDLLSIVDSSNNAKLMIEVKASTAPLSYAKLHISKNEWETAILSENYIFHLWLIGDSPSLYKISVVDISTHIPNNNKAGQWESVEIPFRDLIGK
jgi:hypothetical protein